MPIWRPRYSDGTPVSPERRLPGDSWNTSELPGESGGGQGVDLVVRRACHQAANAPQIEVVGGIFRKDI